MTNTNHTDATTSHEPRNGLGIAAIILGLVGILFGLVPLTGFIAVALGITGLCLGFAGRGRIKRFRANNRWTTRSGIAASLVALVLGVWGITIVFDAVDQFDQDIQEIGKQVNELEE